MSGASFAIELDELKIIIANDRGYSLSPDDWSDKQAYVINDVVTSGVAQVYFPPAIDGERIAPDWTFLKPITEVGLPAGQQQIRLPDDWGSVDGPIGVKSGTTTCLPWRIQWRNEMYILQLYQGSSTMQGPPKFACEIAFREIEPTGQARGLLVYPIPDQDYILQVKYSIIPSRLSGAMPFAYGGARYRELFIASCLAISEQRFDNVAGIMTKRFNQMLIGAVSEDNKNRPANLGYNGNSEDPAWRGFEHPAPGAFYYNDDPIT